MANSADTLKGIDVRRAARVRTFLQARISYGEGAISAGCTVNQLSDVGARLNIAGSVALPDAFELAIPQKAILRRAKLVWRDKDQVGIEFVDDESAESASDPFARIKALEAENAKLRGQIGVLLQQVHRLTEE